MGCCASQKKVDYENRNRAQQKPTVTQLIWNMEQLQASQFFIDGANIKLKATKNMPYRICSKQPLPTTGRYIIKIRFVSHSVSSFSLGLFHFGDKPPTEFIKRVPRQNGVRLYVSKDQSQVQAEGQTVFTSKQWKIAQEDTVIMIADMNNRLIEWKKQNHHDVLSQKTNLTPNLQNKTLFFELIMYQPQAQLNVQLYSEGVINI